MPSVAAVRVISAASVISISSSDSVEDKPLQNLTMKEIAYLWIITGRIYKKAWSYCAGVLNSLPRSGKLNQVPPQVTNNIDY